MRTENRAHFRSRGLTLLDSYNILIDKPKDSRQRRHTSTMSNISYQVQETINLGKETLSSLYQIDKYLTREAEWGASGKAVKYLMKLFNRTDGASAAMLLQTAKRNMKLFQSKCEMLAKSGEVNLEISEFIVFANEFSGNYLTDAMFETVRTEAQTRLWKAVSQVQGVLAQLMRYGK